jgi:hypothetical protein
LNEKRGRESGLWAVGHLNEMYVRDVNVKQKNTELEGNLNYDNDVCIVFVVVARFLRLPEFHKFR